MNFMESPKTPEEATEYKYMMTSPQIYNTLYKGLSSYIISFSNLHRRECIWLSQVKWNQILPNFIAMEASYITGKHPYNGIDKLHMAVFDNSIDELYAGQDRGLISRTPLTYIEAGKACLCVTNNCTFALKLY